ncbi:MAG: LacI family DNA-binding transcriptional regulator [Woeseiaceae bacterium]|nr:LacI family DNA-binding transcriptional regulator [Woeseiaceae bacterium]
MRHNLKATINDVANLAGVSIKTVSRVVNNEPNVRRDTRDRVERAIADLSYRPNVSARNLASNRARLIVLVYDDPAAYEAPSSGYVTKMQEGALRACKEAGYELLIQPCNYRERGLSDQLRKLVEYTRPSGVVIAAPLSNMPRIVKAIEESGVPFVTVSRGQKSRRHFSVATNDREISKDMTLHLVSEGHKRIAFICGDPEHAAVANRFDGYKDGLEQAGIRFASKYVCKGDNSIGSGEKAAGKLLDLAKPPTAVFAANDDMAAGVMRAAAKRGLTVPDDLSVAGCDDISLARQVYPALTTIRQPFAEMVQAATSALIEKRLPPGQLELVPGSLSVRGSTGPAPKS